MSEQELFEGAKANFQKALALDPGNQRYRQLLEAMESAPQLHAQVTIPKHETLDPKAKTLDLRVKILILDPEFELNIDS